VARNGHPTPLTRPAAGSASPATPSRTWPPVAPPKTDELGGSASRRRSMLRALAIVLAALAVVLIALLLDRSRGNERSHVLIRNAMPNQFPGYALYWSTTDAQWKKDLLYFDVVARTFAPRTGR
jgi:hypothetical protein